MAWIVYDHPADCPDHFVVRRWHITTSGLVPGPGWPVDALADARELVPPGLVCIPRHPDDDPAIVEMWI